MLPKPLRLTHTEINTLKSNGKKIRHGPYRITILPSLLLHSRLAVHISKKVDKRATKRNRIKRILTEAFRTTGAVWNKPVDLFIEIFLYPKETTTEEMKEMLRKISERVYR